MDEHRDVVTDAVAGVIDRLRPYVVVTATSAVSGRTLDVLAARADEGTLELVPNARTVRLTSDREALRRAGHRSIGPADRAVLVRRVGRRIAGGRRARRLPHAGRVGERPSRAIHGGRPDEVEAVWHRAIGQSETLRVLAETVVEVEVCFTLLAIRTEGPGGPVIEFCSPIGHRRAEQDVLESWQPQPMSPAALDAAKSIAARIVKALGGRGVVAVELMIHGDEVYFAAVGAVLPQSAWVTLRSQRISAIEQQARAILGLPVDALMISPAAARSTRPATTAATLTAAVAIPETDLRVFWSRAGPAAGRGAGHRTGSGGRPGPRSRCGRSGVRGPPLDSR